MSSAKNQANDHHCQHAFEAVSQKGKCARFSASWRVPKSCVAVRVFESTMKNVGKDIQQAIPTDFDTQVQATANVNSFTNGNDNSFLGRAVQTFNNTINFGEVHINSEMDIDDVAHRVSSVIVSDILVKGGAYT